VEELLNWQWENLETRIEALPLTTEVSLLVGKWTNVMVQTARRRLTAA